MADERNDREREKRDIERAAEERRRDIERPETDGPRDTTDAFNPVEGVPPRGTK